MPSLLIFAPCDNILINKVGDSASLIVILTEIKYPKPDMATDAFGPGTILPLRWYIFCQWLMMPEDVGITFQQKLQIGNNDEMPIMAAEQDFTGEEGKIHHRMIAGLPGFPVLPPGIYPIKVSIRKKGDEDWTLSGSYPIGISYSDSEEVVPAT